MIWTVYWLTYANFSEKEAFICLAIAAVFVAALFLIEYFEKYSNHKTLNAKNARNYINKRHKAQLKRFYKKSVRKMKFAIARAVRAGKNEVMLDFQSIWELDATKREGNEFEDRMTITFQTLGFDVRWVCDVDKGPELMYVNW